MNAKSSLFFLLLTAGPLASQSRGEDSEAWKSHCASVVEEANKKDLKSRPPLVSSLDCPKIREYVNKFIKENAYRFPNGIPLEEKIEALRRGADLRKYSKVGVYSQDDGVQTINTGSLSAQELQQISDSISNTRMPNDDLLGNIKPYDEALYEKLRQRKASSIQKLCVKDKTAVTPEDRAWMIGHNTWDPNCDPPQPASGEKYPTCTQSADEAQCEMCCTTTFNGHPNCNAECHNHPGY